MSRPIRAFFVALAAALAAVIPVQGAGPVLEPMYANDSTVFMSAPQAVAAGGIQTSQDFYIVAYSRPTTPPDGPITLGLNYHPLCDPCLFPGPPVPAYRDVVLNGAPGFGTDGTAGSFNPNWHVFVVVPTHAWLTDPSFVPVRSTAELDAGEAAGHFLPINVGGENPFEMDTGIIFLCVLVSSHA
jgi:hypothetical protein